MKANSKKKSRTKTRDFGSSGREGHDSSRFYSSRLYDGKEINEKRQIIDNSDELDLNDTRLLTLLKLSKLNDNLLKLIPNHSLHLIILQILDLDEETALIYTDFKEWLINIEKTIGKLKEKLITGGRLVTIVNNEIKQSKTYFPLNTRITRILLDNKFILRGNIILTDPLSQVSIAKQAISEKKTADIPKTLINKYMLAIIACKDILKRQKKVKKNGKNRQEQKNTQIEVMKTDTISRDQFLSYTKSIWYFEPALINPPQAQNNQFLPIFDYIHRFLHLLSFKEDNVMLISNFSEEVLGNLQKEFFKSIRPNLIYATW